MIFLVLEKTIFFLPKTGVCCERLSRGMSIFLELELVSTLKSMCTSLSCWHYISTEYCTSLVVDLPLREENTKMLISEY